MTDELNKTVCGLYENKLYFCSRYIHKYSNVLNIVSVRRVMMCVKLRADSICSSHRLSAHTAERMC